MGLLTNKNIIGAYGKFFIRIFGTVIAKVHINWLTSIGFLGNISKKQNIKPLFNVYLIILQTNKKYRNLYIIKAIQAPEIISLRVLTALELIPKLII
ncbi:hypothetical protein ACFGVS_03615 [Mucilaginibacter sp. AW1-7]|jgi:hypothetical protein|uniref:hypothetical protein n=1 Tax=unclassified Mucilaginibacter TaxID=2617802 RepID=UPI0023652208|nr:hypothetical protein [Mucilaginibacter sp. KACC 22773]WDF81094.1 hypothetical protein PQ469_13870 [Mucilaginibacter sp. KACC 22773]